MTTCGECNQDLAGSPVTVVNNVLVHATCVVSFRKRHDEAMKRACGVRLVQGWKIKWEEDEYGPYHAKGCRCPEHRELDEDEELPLDEQIEFEEDY